jgi:hypothetical protein
LFVRRQNVGTHSQVGRRAREKLCALPGPVTIIPNQRRRRDGTRKLFNVADDGKRSGAYLEAGGSASRQTVCVPVGGTQLGCTFVNGDIPVSVGLNGQMCIQQQW